MFWWRRRARDPLRHTRTQSVQLFDPGNNVGSSVAASRRTSVTSAGRTEMVQPQQTTYTYPRPPVMMQGAYVQPAPVGYEQQPPMAQGVYGQPHAVGYSQQSSMGRVMGNQPPSATSSSRRWRREAMINAARMAQQGVYGQPHAAGYSQQQPTGQGYGQPASVGYQQAMMAQDYEQRSIVGQNGYPQPPMMAHGAYAQPPTQSAYSQQPVIAQGAYGQPQTAVQNSYSPPASVQSNSTSSSRLFAEGGPSQTVNPKPLSKLERERVWQNNGASASGANSARTSVELGYARDSVVAPNEDAYGGLNNAEPNAEAVAPPSYSVQ
ncbi:hypothetical protein B0H13DRAFT_2506674 [Mycena leptocephala]|nr:hypothetical protein B0H13DRAFT_2506674 [Mycena leptocephala]